ncbi:hypothetical protein, partial [Enterococcus faecalis]|uniref:hypothetical protein n=1 Tax=Enterococcus faecalis TaxID=1351 RepID=UPI00403F008B
GTLHADLQGPGTLITTGTTSVTGGAIGAGVFAGGLVWQIKGTATFAPGATLHVTDPAALIAVTSSGSLTFAGNGGIVDSNGPAHVTNAGTIAKT